MIFSKKGIAVLTIFFFGLIYYGFAQQMALLDQSAYNTYLLNPAAVGLTEEIKFNTYFKKQWAGIIDSPQLSGFSIDGDIKNRKIGLACNVFNEQTGIFSKTMALLTYRYKLKIGEHSQLLFGISPGIRIQQCNFSKIKAEQPNEFSRFPLIQTYTIPDVSVGAVYLFKELELGFSGSQLFQNKFKYRDPFYNTTAVYQLVPFYQLYAKHTFKFKNEKYKYTPTLIVRTIQGLPIQIELNNTLVWSEILYAGIGYRQLANTYLNIGYAITNRLRLMYSYEHNFNGIASVKGAHELGLCFRFTPLYHSTNDEAIVIKNKQVDELYEKIDLTEQKIEKTEQKVDTIDRNLNYLKKEIEKLKEGELNNKELKELMNDLKQSPQNNKKSKYNTIKIDSQNDLNDLEDTPGAKYNIILGVYKNYDYAKSYQTILERQFGIKSKVIQTEGVSTTIFYISLLNDYEKVKDASEEFMKISNFLKKQSVQITNGDPWLLQTNK